MRRLLKIAFKPATGYAALIEYGGRELAKAWKTAKKREEGMRAARKKITGKPHKGPGTKGKIHAVPDPKTLPDPTGPTVTQNRCSEAAPPPMDHTRVLADVTRRNGEAEEYISDQFDALNRRIDETGRVVADAMAVVEERTRLLKEAVAAMDIAQQKRFRAIAAKETFRAVARA